MFSSSAYQFWRLLLLFISRFYSLHTFHYFWKIFCIYEINILSNVEICTCPEFSIMDSSMKDLFLKIIKINACSSTIYTFGERDREYLFLSQASESLWKCWWKWPYLMLKTKYQASKNSQNLNFYILFLILGFLLTDLPITYKNLIFYLNLIWRFF